MAPSYLQRLSLLLLVAGLGACDPPCETYWKQTCEKCGDGTGCDIAKERCKTLYEDPAKCQAAAERLSKLLNEPGGKNIACSLPKKGELPSLDFPAKWRCGDTTLVTSFARFTIGSQSYEVVQLTDSTFNIKATSSMQTSCQYKRSEERFQMDCLAGFGPIPKGVTSCVQIQDNAPQDEGACPAEHDGKTTCSKDGQRLLECKAGQLVLKSFCRGPKACGHDGEWTTCDESIAAPGEPCDDQFGTSAPKSVNGIDVLECKDNKWAVKK